MITDSFLEQFKTATEELWSNSSINEGIYGFQFQPGTKWNPGLSKKDIALLEKEYDLVLPADFKIFLSRMNGTNIETINVYGNSGEPYTYSAGVYSHPRDAELVRNRIVDLVSDMQEILGELELDDKTKFFPIYGHRYILCNGDPGCSKVCSIYGSDAIYYGNSLKEYLEAEFLTDNNAV